jgi:prepilin-type N-terminal cleavage/methylation domain-containing protein
MIQRDKAFTLIELLIVIAIILTVLVGEAGTARLLLRSTSIARDTEKASAVLATKLAEIRSEGPQQTEGKVTFSPSNESASSNLPEATGEIRFKALEASPLVEVEAHLAWRSVTGQREVVMATVIRGKP